MLEKSIIEDLKELKKQYENSPDDFAFTEDVVGDLENIIKKYKEAKKHIPF